MALECASRGTEIPAPANLTGMLTAAVTLNGFAVGAAWMMQNGGDQATGPGCIGVLIFWTGLGAFFPLYTWD